MDPFVTIATNVNTNIELGLRVAASKVNPTVQLLRDQVMEGELPMLTATRADL